MIDAIHTVWHAARQERGKHVLYHIGRDGQQIGQYSLSDLQSGYASGTFLPTDLVWREGMANWMSLRDLPELAESASPTSAPNRSPEGNQPSASFAPVPQMVQSAADEESGDESVGSGPAWENPGEGNWLERVWATIRSLFTTPRAFFATLLTEGGLGQPLLFYIWVGWIAMAINALLEMPLQWFLSGSTEEALISALAPLGVIIFAPVFIVLGAFFGSGLTHICLMLLGAANRPFEATFRVNCYAYGGVAPITIIPFCGAFVSSIWGLVLEIIGISEVHQISTGKAVLAVLLPMLLCCGLAGGLFVAFGTALFI